MIGEVIIAVLSGKKREKKVKNRTGRKRIEGQKNELEDEWKKMGERVRV